MRCKRTDQSAATVVCFMSPPAKGRRVLTYIRSQRICRSQCVFKNYLRIFCICHSFDIRIEEPYRQTPSDNNAAHGGSGDKLTESQFISSQLIRHEHNTLIRMLSFLRTRCRRCAVHCAALLHLAATYLLLPQVHSFRCVLSDASSAAYRGHQHQHQTWTGAGHGEY